MDAAGSIRIGDVSCPDPVGARGARSTGILGLRRQTGYKGCHRTCRLGLLEPLDTRRCAHLRPGAKGVAESCPRDGKDRYGSLGTRTHRRVLRPDF